MTEVLQANIFFITASIATVVFCLLVSVALFQVIKILAGIRTIVDRIAQGSDAIAEDVEAVRSFVKSGGLVAYLINLAMQKQNSAKRSRAKSQKSEEEY